MRSIRDFEPRNRSDATQRRLRAAAGDTGGRTVFARARSRSLVADDSAAERDFRARCPEFDPDGALAVLRRREYARLDACGTVYLDYAGGSLHAIGQVRAHARLLERHVLGNPHSNNPASL